MLRYVEVLNCPRVIHHPSHHTGPTDQHPRPQTPKPNTKPTEPQPDLEVLQRDKRRLEQSLQRKREHLQELIMQRIAFQRLVRRNTQREVAVAEAAAAAAGGGGGVGAAAGAPGGLDAAAAAALREDEEARKIPLPFIIINTGSQTVIQCEMTEDRSDVFFNFSAPFEINDDNG